MTAATDAHAYPDPHLRGTIQFAYMSNQGYYRCPAIHANTVYFVAEDDIWSVPDAGGIPRRLTAGLGEMGKMAVSPDGQWLAVTAREEKHTEVYVASATG